MGEFNVTTGLLGAATGIAVYWGFYAAAWVASRAYFANKIWYHKRLLQQLEERER